MTSDGVCSDELVWRPIETAPLRDGFTCQAWAECSSGGQWWPSLEWLNGKWWWDTEDGGGMAPVNKCWTVTHWMPRPQPPA